MGFSKHSQVFSGKYTGQSVYLVVASHFVYWEANALVIRDMSSSEVFG
jgi:hypothetical protein